MVDTPFPKDIPDQNIDIAKEFGVLSARYGP